MPSNRLFALAFMISISILSTSVYARSEPVVAPVTIMPVPPVLPPVEEGDAYKVDLNIMNLNASFKSMVTSSTTRIELADESYYTLSKGTEDSLNVEVMLYSPGEEVHKTVYSGYYVWNDQASSLIATTCTDGEIVIEQPEVNISCTEGILMASEIISLEVQGSVEMNECRNDTLEDCLASKLAPQEVAKDYLKCLVNVLGDQKYAQQAINAKIKELEEAGFQCLENGECHMVEDPDVFAAKMESLKGVPTPIAIAGDDRKRFCKLKSHPLMAASDSDTAKYIESYNKTCKKWVTKIYCKEVKGSLYFAFQYINALKQKSMWMPHSFNVNGSGVQSMNVNWKAGVRINSINFRSDKTTLAVKKIKLSMSDDSKLRCKVAGNLEDSTHLIKIGLMGEVAGFEYAKVADGIRIKNLIERT